MASKKSNETECAICKGMVSKRKSIHSDYYDARICKAHLRCVLCGKPIPIDKATGIVEGEAVRFVCNHHHRGASSLHFQPNLPCEPNKRHNAQGIREDDTKVIVKPVGRIDDLCEDCEHDSGCRHSEQVCAWPDLYVEADNAAS